MSDPGRVSNLDANPTVPSVQAGPLRVKRNRSDTPMSDYRPTRTAPTMRHGGLPREIGAAHDNVCPMSRHAFLIIAHDNWEILRIQLRLLDDPRAAIYLHIDKRSTPRHS